MLEVHDEEEKGVVLENTTHYHVRYVCRPYGMTSENKC
jgi:hypothetical protein